MVDFLHDVVRMMCFDELLLMMDGKRTGPENMAMDEHLAQTTKQPMLRVYGWQGSWMSLGYFGKWDEIPAGRAFVRRPTGGGIVDHDYDWTYSLIVPRGFELAEMKPSESYRLIHESIAAWLSESGIACSLWYDEPFSEGNLCFRNPVTFDLMDQHGKKIAGAGQRRTKYSLLHQGSILTNVDAEKLSAVSLAQQLSRNVIEIPSAEIIKNDHDTRFRHYFEAAWNQRR